MDYFTWDGNNRASTFFDNLSSYRHLCFPTKGGVDSPVSVFITVKYGKLDVTTIWSGTRITLIRQDLVSGFRR